MVIVIVSDHCDKDMSHGVSQNVQDYNCGVFFLFFSFPPPDAEDEWRNGAGGWWMENAHLSDACYFPLLLLFVCSCIMQGLMCEFIQE